MRFFPVTRDPSSVLTSFSFTLFGGQQEVGDKTKWPVETETATYLEMIGRSKLTEAGFCTQASGQS